MSLTKLLKYVTLGVMATGCTEEPSSGCYFDSECKGERVCVSTNDQPLAKDNPGECTPEIYGTPDTGSQNPQPIECVVGQSRECGDSDIGECSYGTETCTEIGWGECNAQYPSTELCDNLDNDCDGVIDNDLSMKTLYRDQDGDGYGTLLDTIESCSTLPGYVETSGDCDDTNTSVYPGFEEICDGLDNNCDREIDNGLIAPSEVCYVENEHCRSEGLAYPTCLGEQGWSDYQCDAVLEDACEEEIDNNIGRIVMNCDEGLHISKPDGTEGRGFDSGRTSPVWNPDGSKVAYGSNSIYVLDLSTGDEFRLPNTFNRDSCFLGDWSSQDEIVITCSNTSDGWVIQKQLYTIWPDGSNVGRLTNNQGRENPDRGRYGDYSPSWSPNGSEVVFMRHDLVERGIEIAIVQAETGGIRTVLNQPEGCLTPDWNSRNEIVLSCFHDPDSWDYNVAESWQLPRDLYVMGTDGQEGRRLTNSEIFSDKKPSWSPNGTRVVFERQGHGVHLLDIESGEVTRLANQPAGCGSPDWGE